MPRIVAEVPIEMKRWLQWQAVSNDSTMTEVINSALDFYKDHVGGDVPNPNPKQKTAKASRTEQK